MLLGTVTHFGQGWSLDWYDPAVNANAVSFRDGLDWATIETQAGVYDFAHDSLNWITHLDEHGSGFTVLFGRPSNPLYDGGDTVYTEEGLQAFADFVVATVQAFPGITAIEIGNEFNGNNFVSGPAAANYGQRDDYYAAIVSQVDLALQEANIDVLLIGGAAHSIPVGWFTSLGENGALDHVDAIAIHPYTTPPEQLEDQIAVLQTALAEHDLPIIATEFGIEVADPDQVPAYLAKMTSVMSAAGIAEAHWYAFAKQAWFPNMHLYDQDTDSLTPGGRAFSFFQSLLADGPVSKIAIDDFTYAYSFGDDAVVIWGEPRSITLAEGVEAYDVTGVPISGFSGLISLDEPIVLIAGPNAAQEISGEDLFTLGASELVGESYHQFDVVSPQDPASGGPWSYYALSGAGKLVTLQTMEGGQRSNEPWTPYVGSPWLRPLMVTADSVNPADFENGEDPAHSYSVVERFVSDIGRTVTITGHWDVKDSSLDGVTLTIEHNDVVLFDTVIFDPANGHVFDLTLEDIDLAAGDTIKFIVGPNGNAVGGDLTARSISITEAAEPGEETGEGEQDDPSPNDIPADDDSIVEPEVTKLICLEGSISTGTLEFEDSVGAPLSHSVSNPTHGSVEVSEDGTMTYVAPAGFSGVDTYSVRTVDSAGFVDERIYEISVDNAEPAPSNWSLFLTDDFAGAISGTGSIYGTAGFNDVTIMDSPGEVFFDASFNRGENIVRLTGEADDWAVAASGSRVRLSDGDTVVSLPVGTSGLSISFDDGVRTLVLDETIAIGGQIVGSSFSVLTAGPETSGGSPVETGSVAVLVLASGGSASVAGTFNVIGTSDQEQLTLLGGTFDLDPSFNRGGDILQADVDATELMARTEGSNLLLEGEGFQAKIPVGTGATTLEVSGQPHDLLWDEASNAMWFGGQVIGEEWTFLTLA